MVRLRTWGIGPTLTLAGLSVAASSAVSCPGTHAGQCAAISRIAPPAMVMRAAEATVNEESIRCA